MAARRSTGGRFVGAALRAALLVGLTAAGVRCGDDSSDDGGVSGGNGGSFAAGGSAGAEDGSTDAVMAPPDSCIQPGDPGNENGIGKFCSPLGGQCRDEPLAPICLADVIASESQWFCTRVGCMSDDQCGSGAFCLAEGRGAACVPTKCMDGDPPDAGGDAPSD